MKTLLAIAISVALSAQSAELKVATVDLQRLLSEYQRAQEVAKQLREKQVSFQKELDGLRLQARSLLRETEELQKLSLDNALSATELDAKQRAFEVRYDNLRAQRDAELQSFAAQNNKRIVEDVISATRSIGDTYGVNLILNANRANPITSHVLFSKGVEDLTDKVLMALNKRSPWSRTSSEGY